MSCRPGDGGVSVSCGSHTYIPPYPSISSRCVSFGELWICLNLLEIITYGGKSPYIVEGRSIVRCALGVTMILVATYLLIK